MTDTKLNYNKFGILGGIGPASSMEYYQLIIRRFKEKLKTEEYPEFTFHNINMKEMLGYIYDERLDKLIGFLVDRIQILENAGAELAAFASNTPHIVFEEVSAKVQIPLISIVEATSTEVYKNGIKRVGLLGTKSTMTAGFYARVAEKYGIEVFVAPEQDLDYIHNKYMGELLYKQVIPETKKQFIKIVTDLKQAYSIEGLILGGTELLFLFDQSDFDDIQLFDSFKIHVEHIVDRIIE